MVVEIDRRHLAAAEMQNDDIAGARDVARAGFAVKLLFKGRFSVSLLDFADIQAEELRRLVKLDHREVSGVIIQRVVGEESCISCDLLSAVKYASNDKIAFLTVQNNLAIGGCKYLRILCSYCSNQLFDFRANGIVEIPIRGKLIRIPYSAEGIGTELTVFQKLDAAKRISGGKALLKGSAILKPIDAAMLLLVKKNDDIIIVEVQHSDRGGAIIVPRLRKSN